MRGRGRTKIQYKNQILENLVSKEGRVTEGFSKLFMEMAGYLKKFVT